MNWQMIGAMVGIMMAIVGAATAYLKLFIGNELAMAKAEIIERISHEFIQKEVVDVKFAAIYDRISKLEESMTGKTMENQ